MLDRRITLYKKLKAQAENHLRQLGGAVVLATDRIHLPLPRAGRWIEVIPAELAAYQPDLWAAGRGPGWEAVDWPSGEREVGGEWEVMAWILGRLSGGSDATKPTLPQQLHHNNL